MQNKHLVPGVVRAAIQEGCCVRRLIARELNERSVKRPFRHFDKGNMAVVGKKLRGSGAELAAHKRLPNVAGLGVHSYPLPAAVAEPPARAAPVALVVFHRLAQVAPDPEPRRTPGAEARLSAMRCGRRYGSVSLQLLLPLLEQGRDGTHLTQAQYRYASAPGLGRSGEQQVGPAADPSAADQGGMEHFLDQFTGPLTAWWKVLSSPQRTPELQQKLIAGVHAEVGSHSIDDLAAERDEVLLRLLELRANATVSEKA
jgi:hypothetical protein